MRLATRRRLFFGILGLGSFETTCIFVGLMQKPVSPELVMLPVIEFWTYLGYSLTLFLKHSPWYAEQCAAVKRRIVCMLLLLYLFVVRGCQREITIANSSFINIYTSSVFCYDRYKTNFDIQFSMKRHETV